MAHNTVVLSCLTLPLCSFFVLNGRGSLAFMPSTFPNYELPCEPYRVVTNIDWLWCLRTCSNEHNCISYNFKKISSGKGVCRLNEHGACETVMGDTKRLIFLSGSIYHQLLKEQNAKIEKGFRELPSTGVHSTSAIKLAHDPTTAPLTNSTVSMIPVSFLKITVTSSLKVSTSTFANECRTGWYRYQQACYKAYGEKPWQSWFNASRLCHAVNATLVSIHSKEENQFVYEFISGRDLNWAWIGLSDYINEAHFLWSADNSSANYTNWNHGEPNNGKGDKEEDCVYIGVNATWNDSPCSGPVPFLCKYAWAL